MKDTPRDREQQGRAGGSLTSISQHFDMILDHMPVLVALLDPQFNYVRVNRAYAEADERDPSFFPGRNHFDLYPHAENEVIFRHVVATGEPYLVHAKPFEYAAHPERGVTYWDWSLVPIKDPEGSITILVLTLANAASRVEARETLWESEDRYRDLVENINDVIYALDENGVVTYISPAIEAISGYSPSEVMGRPFADFCHPDDLPRARENVRCLLSGQPAANEVYHVVIRSGESRWLRTSSRVTWDGDRVVGIRGVLTDETARMQAVQALQESERRFKALYQGLPVPVYAWRRSEEDFVLVDHNDAAEVITNGKIIDFLGMTATAMYPDRPDIVADMSRCFAEKTSIQREMTYQFKTTGEIKILVVRYAFVPPDRVLVHTEDITARKQMEDALRESEMRLQLAIAGSNGGTWHMELDPDDPSHALPDKVLISPRLKGFIGYEDDEFPNSMAAWESHVHPEDLARLRESSRKCRAGHTDRHELEYRIRHKDGSIRWLHTCGQVERDTDGRPIYFAGIDWDVTERKQAEVMLWESEERYRDLVEKISDVIYIADTEGKITYISPAVEALTGYSPAEVVNRPFTQFVASEDLERAMDNFQQSLSGEPSGLSEYRVVTASGEVRWIRVSSRQIVDGAQVTGLQGVLTDITEHKRVEEQLKEVAVAEERSRLARELHDATTQAIFSASLIAETLPLVWERYPEEGRRGLEELRQLTQSALAEMRTLLLELRPHTLEEQELDVLIRQLVDAMRARTHMPVTTTMVGESALPVEVKLALYRIAQEALNNVAKHAGGSWARVYLYGESGRATLQISDDGRGFDSADIGPQQLGLEIMRERARAIGAEFTLESRPGQGTEITVTWEDIDEANGESRLRGTNHEGENDERV